MASSCSPSSALIMEKSAAVGAHRSSHTTDPGVARCSEISSAGKPSSASTPSRYNRVRAAAASDASDASLMPVAAPESVGYLTGRASHHAPAHPASSHKWPLPPQDPPSPVFSAGLAG